MVEAKGVLRNFGTGLVVEAGKNMAVVFAMLGGVDVRA